MKWILVLLALVSISLLAVGQTTWVDTYWSGAGSFNTHFQAGDDFQADLWTAGNSIIGEFHGKDLNNNPYNYGVDNCSAWVGASVTGGTIQFYTERLDSKASYCAPGQWQNSFVGSTGTAELGFYSSMNYAEFADCEFCSGLCIDYGKDQNGVFGPYGASKPRTTNGVNFEATGTSYTIQHDFRDSSGDGAMVYAAGGGSAEVLLMGAKAGDGFNMGYLPVCGDGCAWYDHYATFSGNATGATASTFTLQAWADNQLDVGCCGNPVVPTVYGGGDNATQAQYNLTVNYYGAWNYDDLGVKGD